QRFERRKPVMQELRHLPVDSIQWQVLRRTPALESKSMARHRQFRAKRTATPAVQNSFRAPWSIPANTTSLPILAIVFPIESELDLFDRRTIDFTHYGVIVGE